MNRLFKKFFIMLRNQKNNSVSRGIFLIGGWKFGLDRFFVGDKKVVFYQSLVGISHFLALYFVNIQFMNMLKV